MPVLLFVIGGVAVVLGFALVGLGLRDTEFTFGNTLISTGATTIMGGLVLVGLGAVVAKLQQIADGLLTHLPANPVNSIEASRGRAAATPVTVPFPPKPKSAAPGESRDAAPAVEPLAPLEPLAPPLLRNPDVPPVRVDEEISLSPAEPELPELPDVREPPASERPSFMERPAPPADEEVRHEPKLESDWRPSERPTSSYFDTMWPAREKPKAPPVPADEPQLDLPPVPEPPVSEANTEPSFAEPSLPDLSRAAEPELNMPRAAVLKSGVVDGMAYTLYVDGSIEAELPSGTLHFASITELRSHLEKNS